MIRGFDMELLRKLAQEYFNGNKKLKNEILDRYIKFTLIKREAAKKRFLRYKFGSKVSIKKIKNRGRKKKYDSFCKSLIREIWELSGNICAERLYEARLVYIEQLAANNKLNAYNLEVIDKVNSISLGSLKNIIKSFPKASSARRKGNLDIYKNIGIEANFGKYAKLSPGYIEIDYVEHNGGTSSGTFAITGTYTDLYSQFVARAAGLGKNLRSIEGIDRLAHHKIYFPVVHYHPDNDKSILSLLFNRLKCDKQSTYDLSRSRPYHKNDNAHVEQKNGDKVRQLVGYFRYDSEEEVRLLNKIYEKADLIDNFFIPSFKLQEKVVDAKGRTIKKTYDKPKTPYMRIIESDKVTENVKLELKMIYNSLNLVKLREELDILLDELIKEVKKKNKEISGTKIII